MDLALARHVPWIMALASAGCATVGSVLQGMEKPTADLIGASLQSIGLDRSTIAFDVKIHNPYDIDLPLVDVRYGLASEGEKFLSGEADLSGAIPAGGDKTVTVPATVVYEDLLGLLQQVRPGHVIPYVVELALAVNAPGGGRLEIPLNRTGELPIPAVPKVEVTRVDWDEVGLGGASGTLHLTFENTNQFPLVIDGLDYSLSLGGRSVATTRVQDKLSLERGGRGAMAISIQVPSSSLATAIIGALKERRMEYDFDGAFSVNTPFGDMSMPFDESGQTVVAREDSK